MKKEKTREIAEVVGVLAIVASLLFVGLQLKQDRQFAAAEALAADQIADLELARFLDEKSDVWRKCLADSDLTEGEAASFDLLAYALFRQQSYQLRTRLALGSDGAETQGRSYAFFIYQHPGLRKWFDKLVETRAHRNRAYDLPDDIKFYPKIINDYLLQLDESSPEVPEHYIRPY